MKFRPKTVGVIVFSFLLVFLGLMKTKELEAARGTAGTQSCINCHQTWLDNDPSSGDVQSGEASADYLPPVLAPSQTGNPFYTITRGYVNSIHYTPAFDLTATDYVSCEACHGNGLAHYGVGYIPVPIPQAKTCLQCHNEGSEFPQQEYLLTSHSNKNNYHLG